MWQIVLLLFMRRGPTRSTRTDTLCPCTTLVRSQLGWQDADDGSALSWDASGWIGGDIDRLWLRSEGERSNGKTEEAELQALWGHAVSPWWEIGRAHV